MGILGPGKNKGGDFKMPMTDWEDVIGHKCHDCPNVATHIYGDVGLCCECHAGKKDAPFSDWQAAAVHVGKIAEQSDSVIRISGVFARKDGGILMNEDRAVIATAIYDFCRDNGYIFGGSTEIESRE